MTRTQRHQADQPTRDIPTAGHRAPGVGSSAGRIRTGALCGGLIVSMFLTLMGIGIPAAATVEIPPDDFRISWMGPDGDTNYGAFWFLLSMMAPDVAYNPVTDQYLVVWFGDDDTAPLVDNEVEIFGQLVDAATGAMVGSRFRISFMGPNGYADYAGLFPSVAYNSTDNEFLVVWVGDHSTGSLVNDHFEVFGRRVSAAGQLLGSQTQLSSMGLPTDPAFGVQWWIGPDVAYNATDNIYLVVWAGDTNLPPFVDDEIEVWGRRFDAGLTAVDIDQYAISAMGPLGDTAYYASQPAVAWGADHDNFLVVWEGDDNSLGMVNDEVEIFGQFIPGDPNISFVVIDNFQISFMGGSNGNAAFDAYDPDVAYNDGFDNFLVTWVGDDNQDTTVDEEFEVWGRLTSWNGTLLSTQYRLSAMGFPDGDTSYSAHSPAVVSGPDTYHVVWHGDNNTYGMVNDEFEIFTTDISADPTAVGLLINTRLTTMGADGDPSRGAFDPAIAWGGPPNDCLVVWWGDDNNSPSVDNEFEIFGQLLRDSFIFGDGFESGNLSRWSTSAP